MGNYGGYSGYGGMGMGMGMGMMGGYGGMGMMGMGGMGYGMGVTSWLYSINQFVYSIQAVVEMAGMSVFGLIALARTALAKLRWLWALSMNSSWRRWLQRKTKHTRIVRWLVIFLGMALSASLVKIIQAIVRSRMGQAGAPRGALASTIGLAAATAAATNSAARTRNSDLQACWDD
jgi:hypothetical protein